MNTYIVLFRGINVSGQKKMLMAELRDLLSEIGFNKVLTYIQSGNIVLKSEMTASEVEERIHTAILSHFGYDVPIVVRTPYEIQKIIDACPHHGEKKEKSYFTVLKTEPSQEAIEELQKIDYPNEEIVVTKACVYGFFALGAGKAKFNNNLVEQKLKVQATSRNFRTMMKLLSLSSDID
jgi:uncharacterized protein (DUF1697 family)